MKTEAQVDTVDAQQQRVVHGWWISVRQVPPPPIGRPDLVGLWWATAWINGGGYYEGERPIRGHFASAAKAMAEAVRQVEAGHVSLLPIDVGWDVRGEAVVWHDRPFPSYRVMSEHGSPVDVAVCSRASAACRDGRLRSLGYLIR